MSLPFKDEDSNNNNHLNFDDIFNADNLNAENISLNNAIIENFDTAQLPQPVEDISRRRVRTQPPRLINEQSGIKRRRPRRQLPNGEEQQELYNVKVFNLHQGFYTIERLFSLLSDAFPTISFRLSHARARDDDDMILGKFWGTPSILLPENSYLRIPFFIGQILGFFIPKQPYIDLGSWR